MAIKALVIPADPPEVGSDILTAIRNIGAPEVFVPTDKITIGAGETLQIDGTLVVNGTMSGSGAPAGGGSGTGGATALNGLNDVSIAALDIGDVLKWDGTAFTNQSDAVGATSFAIGDLTDVTASNYADNSVLQYDSASSKWIARDAVQFIEGNIDGGVASSTYSIDLNIDGGGA